MVQPLVLPQVGPVFEGDVAQLAAAGVAFCLSDMSHQAQKAGEGRMG